jgi:hypothetical protein
MPRTSERYAGKAIQLSSCKVAKRMAGESIHSQKDDVEKQHQSPDSHADSAIKKEGAERISPKKNEEDEANVQKVAVEVLQNKRKRSLTPITVLSAFADGARGRIKKESAIVSLPIVIARDPES